MNTQKILSLIIAIIMAVTALASCVSTGEDASSSQDSEVSDSQSSESPNESSEIEESKEDIGIPDGLDYGNAEVNIYHWKSGNPEYSINDQASDGDPINDAIFKKNLYTEEKLGIKLTFTEQATYLDVFVNALKNAMNDPSSPIDIVSAYSRTLGVATIEGVVQDLNQFDNLDFSKEWWPTNLQEEFNIRGRLYFTSGDISTNLLLMMFGVYYNAHLLESYNIEDPVALVRRDEWTIDKFIELSSGVYQDLDNTLDKSDEDFFGLACAYYDFDAIYHGAGYGLVEKSTEEGKVVKYTDELFSDVVGSFIDKMSKWAKSNDSGIETDLSGKFNTSNIFLDSRALFRINSASYGFTLRESDINYGIVPMPKLDPSVQKSFVTCIANPFSLYGISTESKNPERAAATLQTLGYYAKEYTTPATFDVTLKGKFSKNEDILEMWDLMRKGISFDIGRIFHTSLNGPADLINSTIAQGASWAIMTSGLQLKSRHKVMERLNATLMEMLDS